MGRLKLKKTKDWKAKFRPYNYRDLFEKAVERTVELGLPEPEIQYVNLSYFTPERLNAFGEFIAKEFAPLFADGLVATCVIVHSGLLDAVEGFFGCHAYFTVGSVTTPRGEMYPLSEEMVRKWLKDKVNVFDLEIHTWITLDSMEIIDMTFLPTIANVSGRPELYKQVATNPDFLPHAQPQNADDPLTLPNGMRYNPFLLGREFLTRLGAETISINY
jgi:hypothetical protein